MSQPLVYIDTSEVREGALDELKGAIAELVAFIDVNEPQILAYSVYLSDDGSRMTVVHVHADSASLDYHMDVASPAFRRFADLLTLSSIRVYGAPSDKALRQLHEKARLLGCEDVTVHAPHAGFTRFGTAEKG
jgi:quinol monooxygenase YgiN